MIRLLRLTTLVLSFALLSACGDDGDPVGPPAPVQLTSGTPVTNISGAGNFSQKVYRIAVPSGKTQLSFTTSGGTGDVDIYVRRGSPPTETSVDDCDSVDPATDESCILPNPAAGDWYILLLGITAYSGVTLTATVTP